MDYLDRNNMTEDYCCSCCGNCYNTRPDTILRLKQEQPFTEFGISPYFAPLIYPNKYDSDEDEDNTGGCKTTGYPDDPLYPTDPRKDCLAFTPIYRQGQHGFLAVIDAHANHGPNALTGNNNSSPPIWHEWDGITIFPAYSPDTLTPEEKAQYRKDWFCWIFPGKDPFNDYTIRGLKQLYDLHQPFKDETAPTVSEFEQWNDKVINHFRTLSGLPPAYPLQELYIMCKWSQERKEDTLWDTKYPGTLDSAYGPCQGGNNLHCGTTFKPDYEDQKPYWNQYYCKYPCSPPQPEITMTQGSEAMTVWYNGNAMTVMSRNIYKIMELTYSGLPIGGHSGTYARRQYYGLDRARSKWAGTLFNPPTGYSF